MLDHIMVAVKDWPAAKSYYTDALKPLGYTLLLDEGTWGGFAVDNNTLGRIYVRQGELQPPHP